MMRKVIEYLRRKQNITIEDLVVEICSSTMYYKYLSKEKNLSIKNLTLIKERLGADELTKEEIGEFKKDLGKITNNILRYYQSKEQFEKVIIPLIEIEPQILLCDELCVDYIIAKITFLFLENEPDEITKLLLLLEEFFPVLSVSQKLFYYQLKIFKANYFKEDIKEEVKEFDLLLENNRYNKDYGFFHMNITYYFLKLKQREKAMHSVETALSLFNRDLNLIGQVKATNMKAFMLGESRKYQEALELFIHSYNNAKQINIKNEIFLSLNNIITCCFGMNDINGVKKYWKKYRTYLLKEKGSKSIPVMLNSHAISLFTNFEYFQMHEQLRELVELFDNFDCSKNENVIQLVTYYKLNDEKEKIEYIESVFLPLVTGKAHFTYCKWILDKCVTYFSNKRMYKKAMDFEAKYLSEFKKYYFN